MRVSEVERSWQSQRSESPRLVLLRARSSAGRAPGLHPGGRRFEPGRVHHDLKRSSEGRIHFGPRAYSSDWLERTPDKREVGGSNPPRPTRERRTNSFRPERQGRGEVERSWQSQRSESPRLVLLRARSSAGRAPGLQPGGRRFEPGRVHHGLKRSSEGRIYFGLSV